MEAYLIQEDTGESLPDREYMRLPPRALRELRRLERWDSLPREGGLYDQPYHFMRELEAAMVGRARREKAKAVNRKRKLQAEAKHAQSPIRPE